MVCVLVFGGLDGYVFGTVCGLVFVTVLGYVFGVVCGHLFVPSKIFCNQYAFLAIFSFSFSISADMIIT